MNKKEVVKNIIKNRKEYQNSCDLFSNKFFVD